MSVSARGVAAALTLACVAAGCGKGARIDALRDALSSSMDKAKNAAPACAGETKDCLSVRATHFGSKSGFHDDPPDQASAAAVASMIADGLALDAVPSPGAWIASAKDGKGAGGDALRLAVARALVAALGPWAKHVAGADLTRFAHDVGAVMPGACRTYVKLGGGALELADEPDHSACVQRDLGRKHGPGGTYGQGDARAAAGALAFARDWVDALHDGSRLMTGDAKAALDATLATIDADLAKLNLEKVDAPAGNAWALGSAQHGVAVPDAGAPDAAAAAAAAAKEKR